MTDTSTSRSRYMVEGGADPRSARCKEPSNISWEGKQRPAHFVIVPDRLLERGT